MEKNNISCKKATVLMSKSMEQKLSLSEKGQLTAHLAICKTCTFCFNQLKGIKATIVHYAEAIFTHRVPNEQKLSEAAKQRISKHLSK
ncbi:MAG TPA: hypothetical protein VLJ10_03980 [Candidatus Bathyarchaeia archaeon]|nr:hypothetical protein [Candidatus Bathyarchaeia archaeon]